MHKQRFIDGSDAEEYAQSIQPFIRAAYRAEDLVDIDELEDYADSLRRKTANNQEKTGE